MEKKSVLLLGATGLVGSECLKLLLSGDIYDRILILARRPLPDTWDDPRIEQHVIDFDRPDSYQKFVRTDHVICALGTTIGKAGTKENFYRVDFTYSYRIAAMARENGAEHFLLVSSVGANPASPVFYSRVKGELETAIQNLEYRNVTIFRPSLLMGERAEFRMGEEIGKIFSKLIPFALPGKYRPVHAAAVAAAIMRAAGEEQPGVRIITSDALV
ncbi:NAD-dependent epimerase/dehydratase family protein [Desulfococcaceae bacterium HSG8]|nr:NAD-dependent epimerase/dehydratase family protein [Desulfococcaceae bacterium HSG8]